MKHLLVKTLYLICFLFGSLSLYATHIAGGEITWVSLGNRYYEVQLRLYYDCTGSGYSTLYPLQTINVSDGCGGTSFPIYAEIDSSEVRELSFLCEEEAMNSPCNGGSRNLLSFKMFVYKAVIQLPEGCEEYEFNYSLCCRNSLDNVRVATSASFTVASTMYQAGSNESSPQVFINEIPHMCINRNSVWSPGVKADNVDSVLFSLSPALDEGGTINYNWGYSAIDPLPGDINLNPLSGTYQVAPNRQGVYVLSHTMQAYRNGQVVAEIGQNVDAHIISCAGGLSDEDRGDVVQQNNMTEINESYLVCPESEFCFTIDAGSDRVNGDLLNYEHNWKELFPNGTTEVRRESGNLFFDFCASFKLQDYTTKKLVLQLEDNNCPYNTKVSFLYEFQPDAAVRLPEDTVICLGDSLAIPYLDNASLSFKAINRGLLTGELSCFNCSEPVLKPTDDVVLVATTTSAGCTLSDTIQVLVDNLPDISLNLKTDRVCVGAELEVLPSPWKETYSIIFTDSIGNYVQKGGKDFYVWDTPGTQQLNAIIVSEKGCYKSVSSEPIDVVNTVAPQINISGAGEAAECNTVPVDFSVDVLDLDFPCINDSIPFHRLEEVVTTDYTGNFYLNPDNEASLFKYEPTNPNGNTLDRINFQYLYTQESLEKLGLKPGFIETFSFYVDNFGGHGINQLNIDNAVVTARCVNQKILANREPRGAQIFQGELELRSGWVTVTLNNAIFWNGLSDLMLTYCLASPTQNIDPDDAPIQIRNIVSYQSIGLGDLNANSCNTMSSPSNTGYLPILRFSYYPAPKSIEGYNLYWTMQQDTVALDTASQSFYSRNGEVEVGFTIEDTNQICQLVYDTNLVFGTYDTLRYDTSLVYYVGDTVALFREDSVLGFWYVNAELAEQNQDLNYLFTTETPGVYVFQIATEDGCYEVLAAAVQFEENPFREAAVPNVITPNGDGINDNLRFINADLISSFSGFIYDRFGTQVATISSDSDPWSGEENSEGVYFYVIEAVNFAGEPLVFKGFITLLK